MRNGQVLKSETGSAAANPYDRPLSATRFRSVRSALGEPVKLSLREFADIVRKTHAEEKSLLPLISFCRFAGDRRSKENAQTFSAVALDYDGGTVSLEKAARKLDAEGICALLYATPSSTGNAPRWRAIIPMSKVLPAARYSQMVGRADQILGGILARESYSEAQAYFFGSVVRGSRCQTILI